MPSSRESVLRRAVRLAIAGLGLLLLLELSARVHLFGWAGLDPERVNSVRGLPNTGYLRPSADPDIVFELEPDLDGFFKLVPFRTNSRGLRDREYGLEKPPNAFRVAVLGASFALPAGVEIEQAFHSLLEEQLSLEFEPTRVEFVNFAVGAYNPAQVVATLEHRALAYDPDLILFTTTRMSLPWLGEASPATRMPARASLDPFGPVTYPFFQSFLLRLLEQKTGLGPSPSDPELRIGWLERGVMALADRASGGQARSAPPAGAAERSDRPPALTRRPDILGELGAIHARTGIPIAVIHLEYDLAREPAPPAVEERAEALGLHFLDTRSGFEGTRASDFWIYELDPHPNAAAHAIFARVIGEFLRARSLIPPRPRA